MQKAVLAWIRDGIDDNAAEVVSFEETTITGGYCDTCYYEEIRVAVRWKTEGSDDIREYVTYENMADFIRTLDRYDV